MSGLQIVRQILDGVDDLHFAELTSADVVRHRLVADIIDAYGRWDERRTAQGGSERAPQRAAADSSRPPGTLSAMSIEIANESGVDVDEAPIVDVARYALEQMGVSPLAELSILLVELEPMSELHERWLEEPGPTDVMSFPMDELDTAKRPDAPPSGPSLLGDIVLCPAFARDQAVVGRALPRRRAAPAHRARRAAPAGVRPRRAGRGEGDVRPAGRAPPRLAQRGGRAGPRRARRLTRERQRADAKLLGTVGSTSPRTTAGGARPRPGAAVVTGAQAAELVVALLLVPLAGVFAAADAAITTMSPARVDQLVREGRGARALATVVADKPRHLNLVLLLRLSCDRSRRCSAPTSRCSSWPSTGWR